MKATIRKIDRALKKIYNLAPQYKAEQFLVTRPPQPSADLPGALLIRAAEPTLLSLGIYLSETIARQISDFSKWSGKEWTTSQLNAFSIAAEEISHFHCLLHHVGSGRPVTQLEMELQAEIDKFLLSWFAHGISFDELVERLFYHFKLTDRLSDEEKARYQEANALARRFILKFGRDLHSPADRERVFRLLRRFYRLPASEKISLIAA